MNPLTPQFPPIFDNVHFPVLTAGSDLPCANLMGCDRLVFTKIDDLAAVPALVLKEGMKWHEYGDVRWPSPSTWIEIDTTPAGFRGHSGVLVMRERIPEEIVNPMEWVARNNPLVYLFPDVRGDAAVNERVKKLEQQSALALTSSEPGPADTVPRFVQCYCIYRGPGEIHLVARYTDLLNSEGVPIPLYRMADLDMADVEICRFTLHALFRLNEARRGGANFSEVPQLDALEPVYLEDGETPSAWEDFHPMRVLRTRPSIRSLPLPRLHDGVMEFETLKEVSDVRRREVNLHNLAFDLDARRAAPVVDDTNATLGAFLHRACGGAIYSLPDRLTDEFENTDCDEVRLSDIKLPFPNLYLRFEPSFGLELSEGAFVDGCYVVKQGDEYMFSLTSRWIGVSYAQSLSVTCPDPMFVLHLPMPEGKPDLCINESVELGIARFLEDNAPPPDNQSRTVTNPDGTTTFVEDVRAKSRLRRIQTFRDQEPVFRACLNIIVNAICFISFRPEDITEEWDREPPAWVSEALNDTRDTRSARDRRQHAIRVIASTDYTRIRVCGRNLFKDAIPGGESNGRGISPRAHWRRGHWRRQRHGPGLTLVKPMWIRPTIVMKDNGPVVETRFYDVSDSNQ